MAMKEDIPTHTEPSPITPVLRRIICVTCICLACFAGGLFVFACGHLDWKLQAILSERVNHDVRSESIATPRMRSQQMMDYFSEDYVMARSRFIKAAESADAKLSRLILSERGPANEELTIDIAWIGDTKPRSVVLHVSGVHGVEGFAGSAIQLKILENHPKPSEDGAIVFVHILNPYGMAWLRRYNETNVDLNRNFRSEQNSWSAPLDKYAELNDFINPTRKKLFDGFFLQALIEIMRHGYTNLRNVIPKGQGQFPKGLFYCGKHLEQGPELYSRWLTESFASTKHLLVIDVHTGLGKMGKESLFHKIVSNDSTILTEHFDRPLLTDYETSGAASYEIIGGHCEAFGSLPSTQTLDFIAQEFGTYPTLYTLQALRDENRYHNYGEKRIKHPAKQRLREAFNPSLPLWRASVIRDGESLFLWAKDIVFSSEAEQMSSSNY